MSTSSGSRLLKSPFAPCRPSSELLDPLLARNLLAILCMSQFHPDSIRASNQLNPGEPHLALPCADEKKPPVRQAFAFRSVIAVARHKIRVESPRLPYTMRIQDQCSTDDVRIGIETVVPGRVAEHANGIGDGQPATGFVFSTEAAAPAGRAGFSPAQFQ